MNARKFNIVVTVVCTLAPLVVRRQIKKAHDHGFKNGWEGGKKWAETHDDQGNPI